MVGVRPVTSSQRAFGRLFRGPIPQRDVTRDVEVSPLGSEYALASATFTREIVMEGTGATIRQQGAVSWLWRKIGGQWLIVQGHISHPLEHVK